ncbi:DHA1 family arabinose polymer transporter-like MFS transporter [Comamonas sp. BIGb0124]|uniref:MFS transporter n=1 Tax=Comamonas sp. BIGb0124 TaxID=2485130 RepID=UPI000F473DF5|nr:MFS transporter [Comamonas sp. BIGb0124]ROR24861.1 DHA1 family arabinose polymer transporter-like MFS transporter [Comamonas sp. BIGb0124]
MKFPLLSLAAGGFAIGMAEFMLMGVLPNIAQSQGVSIPAAGHLISGYALGVVIGAPLLVALADRYPPRNILVALMVMFGLFNALFALAPTYELMFVARLFSGLPHGAFFGVGAVVAGQLAGRGKEGQAMALMFSGLTVANIVGVPLGTWIGHVLSWRLSFVGIALVALLAAWCIRRWLPQLPPSPAAHLTDSLRSFLRPRFWFIVGASAIGTGGIYAWISYIAPMMTEVAGVDPASVSLVMVLAGTGMALGNYLGGRLTDRVSPLRATRQLLLAMAVVSVLVALTAPSKPLALVMAFVTGAVSFAVIAPLQVLMIDNAEGSKMLASAMIQSTSNIGNALGAYLGGLTIAAGWGYTSPQYVGAALALTGALCCLGIKRAGPRPPSAAGG